MDIYILQDGQEIGPFTEETTQTMLRQGSVREVDFAWHPGLPKWIPLTEVLHPVAPVLETPPPPPPAAEESPETDFAPAPNLPKAGESATEKQKALLGYLGMPFSPELSKDQAALLVNDAMEDAKNATRLAQWNSDRLKLHPELFAAEIQARRESRAGDFFEICEVEGAEYFTKITKAHCQVLVGYLDVKFPHWDDEGREAARKYFFPAVAEKFPQLVAKPWKGKLRYASGPKVAAELSRERPATGKLRKRKSSSRLPLAAITRGLVIGGLVLVMFYFVQRVLTARGAKPAGGAESQPAVTPKTGAAPAPIASLPVAVRPEALPPIEPEKMAAPAEPAPAPALAALPPDPTMAEPAAPALPAAPADPKMAAFPPDPPMAAADPLAPKPASALPGFPPDPPMANAGTPAPVPTPAADPLAPVTPAVPVAPPAAPATAEPGAAAKTNLKLTRQIEVQLAYGKMKLPVGTPVKLVGRDGNMVRVNYLNTVISVPVTSTDLGAPEAAPHPPDL